MGILGHGPKGENKQKRKRNSSAYKVDRKLRERKAEKRGEMAAEQEKGSGSLDGNRSAERNYKRQGDGRHGRPETSNIVCIAVI